MRSWLVVGRVETEETDWVQNVLTGKGGSLKAFKSD